MWSFFDLWTGTLIAVGWQINIPFQHKIGYIRDKVLGEDLVPLG